MNAKQMISRLDGYGGIIPFNSEELDITLRALRLLAAAEANDGSIPEMTKAVQEGRGIELGCQFERERNGLAARVGELEDTKDGAYLERNRLVALLASMFPSGVKKTAIEGWSDDWHSCVYIDFPWGQASWHYHDSHAHLFDNLTPYRGEWDGHTTEQKYAAIDAARGSNP